VKKGKVSVPVGRSKRGVKGDGRGCLRKGIHSRGYPEKRQNSIKIGIEVDREQFIF